MKVMVSTMRCELVQIIVIENKIKAIVITPDGRFITEDLHKVKLID